MFSDLDLILIYLNCNSLNNKRYEIETLLRQHNVDILLLTETFLKEKHVWHVPGYDVLRQDAPENQHGGGIAIVVKKNIQYKERYIPCTNSFPCSMGVRVVLKCGNTVDVVSVYVPNSVTNIQQRDMAQLLRLNDRVILAGDFNAQNQFWNCKSNNSRGKSLLDCVNNQNGRVFIHFPESPTFFPSDAARCPSTIDLCLTKGIGSVGLPISLSLTSSDHNPVKINISASIQRGNDMIKSYIYKHEKWPTYHDKLDRQLTQLQTPTNINELEAHIYLMKEAIITAEKETFPIKTQGLRELPKEIVHMIKSKNRLRRSFQKETNATIKNYLKSLLREAEREIRWEVKSWEAKEHQNKLLNYRCHDTRLFLATNKLLQSKPNFPPLVENGRVLLTTEEKVEALAENFEKVHHQNDSIGDPIHDEEIKQVVDNYFESENFEIGMIPATVEELNQTLSELNPRKSPGNDNIQNIVIKNMSRVALLLFLNIINFILVNAVWPASWKKGIVIPIHKTGKPTNVVTSYRPITLLSTLSKVTEKLVATRLRKEMNDRNVPQDEQFGFRSKHNTGQTLCSIKKDVQSGFKNRRVTTMVSLDIEKAFDTISHTALLYKMICLKFSPSLIKLIKSYLKERRFVVRNYKTLSSEKSVSAGVPQGSVLGPLLFTIFMYDIPMHPHTKMAMFADDTSIRASSTNAKAATRWIQEHINLLENYFKKWKVKVNPGKCEAIQFSKRVQEFNPQISFGTQLVPRVSKLKYLGVTFQEKMNFSEHIKAIQLKVNPVRSKLWPMLGRKSKLSIPNKLYLVKTLIRPIITYNLHVMADMRCSEWKKIEAIQNKLLRQAMGLRPNPEDEFRQMTNEKLLEETKFSSLQNTALTMHAKFMLACRESENILVRLLNY